MEVLIDYAYRRDDLVDLPIEELARFVMSAEKLPQGAEVSISFVDDEEIWGLNKSYRGIDRPTDVLSFECDNLDDGFDELCDGEVLADEDLDDLVEEDEDSACDSWSLPDSQMTAEGFFELGDVVIAPDVAERQCAAFGNGFEAEISLLLVHGLLHLCGYDHIDDDDARAMEQRERDLLRAWADAGHEAVRHVREQ